MKRVKKYFIIGGLVIVSFASLNFANNYFEVAKNLDIMATLYKEVNTYYVDEVDPAKLMRTGIESMLESLDPYTNYISESEVEDYRFMTTGQYGGIGSTIGFKDDYVYITEPYEGSPAAKAGLKAGDKLLKVDGQDVKGKFTADVSKLLKGQPNTQVTVLLERVGTEKPISITITREEINVKDVPYFGMVNDNIGYIALQGFTQESGKEVREALQELKKNPNLKGIILDLRGNPGGLLHEAVNVSNVFIDKGKLVVNTKGKMKEWEKEYFTVNNPIDTSIKLAVLANRRSASASEIVSGVIQDYDRGVIIGQRTFGKGLVQTTRPLTYNSQLKITTAKYYIPSGRCIQALDYTNRNEDGSVGKVPDSLIKSFKTSSGRVVYDGGGIYPDFSTETSNFSNLAISLLQKRLIFDFATLYASKNASIPSARDFKVSDELYQEFKDFLKDKNYDYETKSEKLIKDYKDAAKDEKYFDAVAPEYQALFDKLMHDKNKDLEDFKEEIKELIRDEIVVRYYFRKGVIQAGFNTDPDVQKALMVLGNDTEYNNTLKGTKKATK
jgi:carboxyl-terminal processing protease